MKMFIILKRSLLTGSLATVVAVSGGSAIGQTASEHPFRSIVNIKPAF